MVLVPRVVVDTNVLISALLASDSIPGQAMTKAEDAGQLLASAETLAETLAEIGEVLYRPKIRQVPVIGNTS